MMVSQMPNEELSLPILETIDTMAGLPYAFGAPALLEERILHRLSRLRQSRLGTLLIQLVARTRGRGKVK